MPPESTEANEQSAAAWQRIAIVLWATLVAGVCIRGVVQPRSHSLYPTYAAAGAHWSAGTSLYAWPPSEPGLDAYRYSPLVAVALVPFHALPAELGSVLWRLLNAAVLLGGMAAWLRSPLPWRPDVRQRAVLYLLVLPLALGSLNNGQVNPMVVGFLLAAIAMAGFGRWNLAAASIALATALKVYPVVLGLLLAAVYRRRIAVRLLAALVVVAALPFLFQRPGYVAGEYAEWFRSLLGDDRKSWPLDMAYRDLWLLFRVTGISISLRTYLAIQVISGAACAAICTAGRWRGWSVERVLTAALMLTLCWMIVCGPATESSTYVLLAPALAWGVLAARQEKWPAVVRWLPDVAAALLAVALLAGTTPRARQVHALGLHPLAAVLLFAAYCVSYVRELRSVAAARGQETTVARAA